MTAIRQHYSPATRGELSQARLQRVEPDICIRLLVRRAEPGKSVGQLNLYATVTLCS
jgi:hypothetical protein